MVTPGAMDSKPFLSPCWPVLLALFALAVFPGCNALRVVFQKDSHVSRPGQVEATEERMASLRVAPGLQIKPFARDLEGARMLAVTSDGTVLLTRYTKGDVVALRDEDGDGRAESREVVAAVKDVHGITVRGNEIFLSTVRDVLRGEVFARGTLSALRVIIDDLPPGGQHPKRTLGIGPDGLLYVSVGSSCNACVEDNADFASMLRYQRDGTARERFATGLRNTIGFAWHPDSGALFGMDHGSDHRGDETPPEELNHLTQGGFYGWPWAYGAQQVDEEMGEPPGPETAQTLAAKSIPMLLGYTPHAAPIGMVFLERALGAYRRGDAVVAFRGSWNRERPSGYEVAAIRFEAGRPTQFAPLVRGFLAPDGSHQFGRPTGLVQLKDGSLLFADEVNGVIYRVSETGEARQE